MRSAVRRLAACLLCCGTALAVSPVVALGEGAASEGAAPVSKGSGASSSLGGSLVTPGSPVEGEEAKAAEEAKLANPDAVAEREASQTKYEGLNAEGAEKTDGEAFPGVIDEPAGGPPKLPAGESITGYPNDNVAQLDLPEDRHGVLESLLPMAVETTPGQRTPVDLGLSEEGGVFAPKVPFVPVRIPKRLSEGVQLGTSGVSVTPVDAQGSPLAGEEGALDGASVLYANTQTDTDTVVKPTAAGFEADTMLRSVDSPELLFFRVGLPEGASLVQTGDGSGPVEVIDEGATLATILPPGAHDAAGTAVPVSMRVSRDTLILTVGHHAGSYLYPVEVDPEFRSAYDENLGGATLPTHWKFCTSLSSKCEHTESPFSSSGWGGTTLSDDAIAEYKTGQSAYFLYQSEGDSHIYEAWLKASAPDAGTNIETYLQLAGSGGVEETLSWGAGRNYGEVCAFSKGNNEKCERKEAEKAPDEYGAADNWLHFEQSAYGSGSSFTNTMEKVDVSVAQEGEPEYSFNTTSPELYNGIKNVPNVFYEHEGKSNGWLGPNRGAFQIKFHDPGVGISMLEMQDLSDSWLVRDKFLEEGKCSGVFCAQTHEETVTYNSKLPDGEDIIEAGAKDSVGKEAVPVGPFYETVKVDATPPHNLTLAGLPSSDVIDEGELHLQGKATDGTAPTPSSGIKELRLGLDGYTVLGGKSGSCTQGPCSASGEWTLNGESIGAGKHTLELVAEDNAENIEIAKYTITVRHAGALSVGPGSVNPLTGALHLSANDVSLSGGRGSLGLARSYNSRQLTGGEHGPVGSQWKLSVSGSQEIEQEPTGSVVLVSPSGGRTSFESNGKGGFVSPKGDENLVLEAEKEGEKVKAYLLKDPTAGTTVKYAQVGGAGPWVIASSEGALSKTNGEKETVEWERLEGVTRPKLAIAPAPKGVTCSPTVKEAKELAVGCRALSFTYATETTATGEASSEWKAYKGRLEKVSFTAYNPSAKAMETKPVAEYVYDKQGRLRAEWDPRISPALTTTYGYDSEGHVTSVNPPGGQPSLFHYGTTTSDPSAGRLLSVTRPPVSHQSASKEQAELKEADERPAPTDTGVPTLSSTSPAIGTTLSVSSNGTWSNSPLAYSYAWEDCYTYESKETCTAISGAVNSTYTPQARDAGYTLRAQVTAVNADGTAVATTAASKALAGVAPAYLSKFGEKGSGEKQFNAPVAAAIDHEGNVWVVDHNNDRIEEWSSTGTWLHTYGAKGTKELQFESPEGIAINTNTASPSYGDVYIADKSNNRIEELSPEGKYIRTFGTKGKEPGQLTAPEGIAIVPAGATTSATSGEVWVGDSGDDRVDEFTETGEYIGSFGTEGSGEGQFKGPDGIAFSGEDAYVVDSGNDRVQEFSMSGQYLTKFGVKGTGNGQFEAPYGIATEPVSGDLYVADSANNRIQEFSPTGAFLVAYGKKGEGGGEFSGPDGVAVSPAGDIYVADTANNRVQELEPKYSTNNPLPEPPALGASAVSTIDYNVPVSGSGAPHEMTEAELEKWGQKDDPIEATAMFPSDEPMGWPAKDYKRASIAYYDEFGRTVNEASPSGGISTSEYNEDNELVRSLSADNREVALKEGSKSKEASERLDTKSTYNTEDTQLLETLGPEHEVKPTAKGTEQKERAYIKYYYDEGAPSEGGPYNLVTKTVAGGGNYEFSKRTTVTSYEGQGGLGWKLRKPTSVTTDFGGLDLTTTTVYDPTTGNMVEKREPGAEQHSTPKYQFQSGGWESQHWQLHESHGIAVDKEGNVWVADAHTGIVDEFNAAGAYVRQFGSKGSGNGQLSNPEAVAIDSKGNIWVADTGNYRIEEFNAKGEYVRQAGSYGTEHGQFERPEGIAVDASGNVWVTDNYENRIEKFNEKGEFVAQIGEYGSGNGQLGNPHSIVIDSNGNAWVADKYNNRIEEFNSKGEYVSQVATNWEGKHLNPWGVALGASGMLWIGSYYGAFELSSTGSVLLKLQPHIPAFTEAWGMAMDASKHVWVARATEKSGGTGSVEEFTESGEYLQEVGREGQYVGQLIEPGGVALDSKGDVWVADGANYRVQEFNSEGSFVRAFGSYGSGNGQFEGIGGVAVDSSGNVWVADSPDKRVEEFKESGAYVTQFTVESELEGGYSSASGIAIDSKSHLWIVGEEGKVREYSEGGSLLTKFGKSSSTIGKHSIARDSNGHVWVVEPREHEVTVVEFPETGESIRSPIREFNLPIVAGKAAPSIGADGSGNVWVGGAYEGHPRVQEFNTNGEFVTQIGSSEAGPEQFTSVSGIAVDASDDVWVSDQAANHVDKFGGTSQGYIRQVTSAGTTTASLKKPNGVTVDSSGHVWVADTENNGMDEYSSTGEHLIETGAEGTALGQFKDPHGLAADSEGHVWVADTGNSRLEELSSTGTAIRAVGSEGAAAGQLKDPVALALDSAGNVWVADTENNRVEEFSSTGQYIRQFNTGYLGAKLKKPEGIAIDSSGNVWVVSGAVVEGFSATGEWIARFGKEGTGNGEFKSPAGIAISGETAYIVDRGNNRVQDFKLKTGVNTSEYLAQFGTSGTGGGQFKEPQSIVLDKEGHVWVTDAGNNRAQELSTAGVYTRQVTASTTPVPIKAPDGTAIDSTGHVWVADTEKSRVDELSSTGEYLKRFGTEGSGEEQFKKPQGIAIDSAGHVWIADTGNNRIEELSSSGFFIRAFGSEGTETGKFKKPAALAIDSSGNVWVADTQNNRVQEFSSTGTYLREYTEGIEKPEGIAADASGDVWVSNTSHNKVVELSSTGLKLGSFGNPSNEKESGNGQFNEPAGIAISGETAYVVDRGNSRVEEFQLRLTSGEGEYVSQFGAAGAGNGELTLPQGAAADKEGHVWVADSDNNRVQELLPAPASPLVSQTIYYTAAENKAHPACGKHPEWAELPCQSQPAGQPGTTGLPSLPVVTDETYNMWDEPETVTENFAKVGSYAATTRTKTMTYDSAGRLLTNEDISSPITGSTLPKVRNVYSSETGAMVEQSTTVGESTKTIKSAYDTLARLTEYTDADSTTTQYVYSGPANDGQVEEINYGGKKGSQIYSYNETTKALEKLLDVGPEGGMGAGTFTAGYDVEGRLTSETYPNGMTAKYAYNPAGEATGLEYEKTTHCTEKCVWFSETVVPGIHGETLARTSTLAKEEYTYDTAGRLTQVNETPAGKGCKTRIYAYDEDSDRTSETTRESETETCATSGGTEEKHSYDTADRLLDSGVEYETLGNQTKIPAADAGEHEITASFYVDNQVAVQKQNGETTSYTYDPAGRTEKTVSEGTTKATVIDHYPGSGGAISWVCEENAKECEEGKTAKWTRNIAGIDGSLAATQHDSEAAVLQLHDLDDNVIATAADSETETKLLTTYNPTEFGVPVNGTPPTKFSWLGATGVATEQASGQANPGGSTYVSQLGAPLQTQPVESPGAYSNGSYNGAVFSPSPSAEALAQSDSYGAGAPVREAERLQAQKEETEKQAYENECHIASCEQHNGPGEGNCEASCEVGEGEEEEGVATGGDPFKCEVVSPYPLPTKPGRFKVRGGYYCEAYDETDQELLLHISAQVEVCLEEELAVSGVYGPDRCEITTYADRQAAGFEYEASCSPGHNYRTWTWVYWWGAGPMYHNPAKRSGSVEKCP
jgi:YD repeat-containing protein